MDARVGLVIPTLGKRPDLLRLTLESIRHQSESVRIVMVAPASADLYDLAREWQVELLEDPGGLVLSINAGMEKLLEDSSLLYVGWLNDDDLLEPDSMASVVDTLERSPKAAVAFGACRYIDQSGRELFVSRAGKMAPKILPWGPDLIPQPGMLVRAAAWKSVGGLDPAYRLAFDLDLLLRLRSWGSLEYTGTVVSSFRWHPESLTVEDRSKNLEESERAKRAAIPKHLRGAAWLWERPVRLAIRVAASRVNKQARQN